MAGEENGNDILVTTPSVDREHYCLFFGDLGRSSRKTMASQLQLPNNNAAAAQRSCKIVDFSGRAAPEGPNHYHITTFKNVTFCPCPAGNSIETFRFYEALEFGCIPVIVVDPNDEEELLSFAMWENGIGEYSSQHLDSQKTTFHLKDVGVIVAESWPSAKLQMDELYNSDVGGNDDSNNSLLRRQRMLIAWWLKVKSNVADRIALLI